MSLLLPANGDDDDWIWLTLRFDAAVLILKSTQADKKDTVISYPNQHGLKILYKM